MNQPLVCQAACEKAKTCYWRPDAGRQSNPATAQPWASNMGRDVWPYCQYHLNMETPE